MSERPEESASPGSCGRAISVPVSGKDPVTLVDSSRKLHFLFDQTCFLAGNKRPTFTAFKRCSTSKTCHSLDCKPHQSTDGRSLDLDRSSMVTSH
jgi:hypothetical protein